MKQHESTRQILLSHYEKYPLMLLQDIFKFLHQSAFGCEHMVSSLQAATEYIRKESNDSIPYGNTLIDRLDGNYSRVHLGYLKEGLSADTLGRLFYLSSQTEDDGKASLEGKLCIVKELINENALPFSADEFDKAVSEWKADGYRAMHHSEVFRKEYKPAYRVISNRYVPFLPLFAKIDRMLQKGKAVIAIEGSSASGKTTLGEMLKEIYGCTVFHTDDFFLRPEQRTPERLAEIGGNLDRERFIEEVLIPLEEGKNIDYRRFDCSTMTVAPSVTVKPESLVIIEGAYSMHPEFEKHYDLSVFLDISPRLQKSRIENRNSPQTAIRFFNEWIPMEQEYFSKTRIKDRCNMSISIE